MRSTIIRLNNRITRWRAVRVRPENLLLLAPHCLQMNDCERNVGRDIGRCGRCGRCDLSGLLSIRDEFGLRLSVAAGGRQALALVRQPDIRAVVAIACHKELLEGIRACFPKPVLAVPNLCPNGPCKETRVDLAAVREAIRCLLSG